MARWLGTDCVVVLSLFSRAVHSGHSGRMKRSCPEKEIVLTCLFIQASASVRMSRAKLIGEISRLEDAPFSDDAGD